MCITSLNSHLAPTVVWKGGKEELLNFLFFTKCLITVILAYIGQPKSDAVMPGTQLIGTKKSWINYSKLSILMLSFIPLFHQKEKQAKAQKKLLWYCIELRYIWQWEKKNGWNSVLCVLEGKTSWKFLAMFSWKAAFITHSFSVSDKKYAIFNCLWSME